jgi:OOP family OmpA-OmpF porin
MEKNILSMPLVFVLLMSTHAVLQAAEELASSWSISPMLSYIKADDDRRAEDDIGVALALGKSINESWDIELSFVSDKLVFNSGFKEFDQRGLILDGLYFFDRQKTVKAYAVLGAGMMDTMVGGVSNTNALFNAGVGVMREVNDYGIALRADIRYRVELDNNTVPFESEFGDLILNVGVRIPFGKKTPPPVAVTTPTNVVAGIQFDKKMPPPDVVIKPADADLDGVLDDIDYCLDTAAAVQVDEQGCEVEQDSDKDGVMNSQDQCPNSAEGTGVDIHGCELQSFILNAVNFEKNSAVLASGTREILEEIAATLKKNPGLKVEVAGYTDTGGPVDFNQHLSGLRAAAVKVYLESLGVAAKQLTARGYGIADPVGDNSTLAGRNKNRRVELHILN